MKTANTLFNGSVIQYTPDIYIEIIYHDDDYTYTFDLKTKEGWKYNYTKLDEVHALAIKAMAQEAAE